MAKVLRHVAVGSSGGIDGLRPAQLRHLTSNSTAETGQLPIRSLTALVNRLLNVDVSDNARKLLFSGNLTALRKKDGGIRPIAVGNVLGRLASTVSCAAVTPSLARQLSPMQIGVGSQGACEAAVHAIRRYVIYHTESGQSHQNRLIAKLDFKKRVQHCPSRSSPQCVFRTRPSNGQTGPKLPLYRSRVWSPDQLCFWHSTRRSSWSRSPYNGS